MADYPWKWRTVPTRHIPSRGIVLVGYSGEVGHEVPWEDELAREDMHRKAVMVAKQIADPSRIVAINDYPSGFLFEIVGAER